MARHTGTYYSSLGLDWLIVKGEAEIEAVGNRRIVVLGYSVDKAVTISDGTSTVSISGSYSGGPAAPAFEFAAGAGITVKGEGEGHLAYVVV